jgi:hypothetical protein
MGLTPTAAMAEVVKIDCPIDGFLTISLFVDFKNNRIGVDGTGPDDWKELQQVNSNHVVWMSHWYGGTYRWSALNRKTLVWYVTGLNLIGEHVTTVNERVQCRRSL